MSLRVWIASLLTAVALFAALGIGVPESRGLPALRSEHSQPALTVPQEMVAITPQGKTFHQSSCQYIHGKPEMVTAQAAVEAGYVPCVRCMRKALEKP